MVYCGVILGQLLPNAAIELGQNSFLNLFYFAAYKQLYNAPIFSFYVNIGFFYPDADNNAVKQ